MSDRTTVDFTLTVASEDPRLDSVSRIRVRCSDVQQLMLPELATSFFLAEIEIEDVSSHQIEEIKYRLNDFGESTFEVLCRNIEWAIGDSGRVPAESRAP